MKDRCGPLIAHPIATLCLATAVLAACTSIDQKATPQTWYEIEPDITATLKFGVDRQRYALGAVSDYASPAGSEADNLVYVARADESAVAIPQDTAITVAGQFANVALCKAGVAQLSSQEPPVYRKDINSWAIALDCKQ